MTTHHFTPVADIRLQWGESLRWDDMAGRLYFVDCATQRLHWLDNAAPPLQTMQLPGLPTGVILTDDSRLIVALDDGLHLVAPEHGSTELLTPYPTGLGGRANDAVADLNGNLVTGTLSLENNTAGSYWSFSWQYGWRRLDGGIGNANGPVVVGQPDDATLVFADTPAGKVYAYDYDSRTARVDSKQILLDTEPFGGLPDGACADGDGGIWSCVLGSGVLVRSTRDALSGTWKIDNTVTVGAELPSDVTFGGAALDRMFVVSIAVPIQGIAIESALAGALLVTDVDVAGRPEPRFHFT